METQGLNLMCIQKVSIGIINKEFIGKIFLLNYLENKVTTFFLQTIISEDNISW